VTGSFQADSLNFGIHLVTGLSINDMFVARLGGLTTGLDTHVYSENRITLFPNPAQNFFVISSMSSIEAIELFNITGTEVLSEKNLKPDFKLTITLNASDLSPGIYFVKLQSGDFCETQKLMIAR